ncbi:MAG: hypothetical protein JNK55_00840 [Rubrivivax sp.]|nr:hypothetical protein [Rubrivivax sp.]
MTQTSAQEEEPGLPTIDIEGDGDLPTVGDQVEDALVKQQAPIWQRGGMLCTVANEGVRTAGLKRDPSAPRIVTLSDIALMDVATRHIAFRRRNRKTKELVDCDCPRLVAQTILARSGSPFPSLETVVEHPIMLPDGQVLWQRGYYAEAGILLRPPISAYQAPIESPTAGDAYRALDLLLELLSGFEFSSDVDESVALAFLLSPFVRPILPTCPAFAIDAHAPGSGKSTLVRIASRMATGRDPAFMTFRDDPAEMNKLIFAALLEGDQQISIDNIDAPVSGADLAVILTSPVFRGRVLGQSCTASVPTKALLSLNGNNLQIRGDLTRRVLVARLDPMCERPGERRFSFDPISEVMGCRSEYVLAALTIMAAYIQSAQRVDVRPFGSFNEWSRLVREPLVWLGLPDPVDSIRVLEAADPERAQLGGMLQAVRQAVGAVDFKAAALIALSKAKNQAGVSGVPSIDAQHCDALREALQAVCERNGELNSKALGRWLTRYAGRINDGLRFVLARVVSGSAVWKVEEVG